MQRERFRRERQRESHKVNKGKMKTINRNAEPEYDIVLIPHYSEANSCWHFLLILEREMVSTACTIQLNSKREIECQKKKKKKDLIVSKGRLLC